jgi:hypothetical protein
MSDTDIKDRVLVLERLVEALIVQNTYHEAELVALRNRLSHEQMQAFFKERESLKESYTKPIYRKMRGLE